MANPYIIPADWKPAQQTEVQSSSNPYLIPQDWKPSTKQEEAPKSLLQNYRESVDAIASGVFHGYDQFATSLLKLGAKYVGLPGLTPEAVQATYDQNTKDFNKVSSKNPKSAVVGQLLGNIGATAPLMLVPFMQGAGVGSLGAIGRLGVNAGNNAIQGGIIGGLTTKQGQDAQTTFNIPEALTGAAIGAAITPVQAGISSFANKTSQLENAYDTAAKSGYTGKILSTDLPDTSLVARVNKGIADGVINKLPSWAGGQRNKQLSQISDSVNQYISKLTTDTAETGPVALMNTLKKHSQELKIAASKIDDPIAREAFNKNYNALFSKDVMPQLVTAIEGGKRDMKAMNDFTSYLFNRATPQDVSIAKKMLGKTGTQQAVGNELRELYESSLETIGKKNLFKINKFLDGLKELEKGPTSALSKDVLDSMGGLRTVMNQYADGVGKKGIPISGTTLMNAASAAGLGGLVGTLAGGPAAIGLAVTPSALSLIYKNSPIKNTLMWLNRAAGKPEMSQYFLNSVQKQLARLGVIANLEDDQVTLDTQD